MNSITKEGCAISIDTTSHANKTWNKEILLQRLRGNKDLFITLLETYLVEKNKYISDYEEALKKSDFSGAKSAVHLVKGVAGQLCAFNLQTIAESLEQACINKQVDLIENLGPQYLLLVDEIETIFQSELNKQQANAKESTTTKDIVSLLNQLSDKITNSDYIEPECLIPIRKAFLDDKSLNLLCNKLVDAINLFDNETASSTLKAILKKIDVLP